MRNILAKSLGKELEELAVLVASSWTFPAPEVGFARYVFGIAKTELPVSNDQATTTSSEINRFDQAPVLAAFGYELSLRAEHDDVLTQAWADGFSRIASRSAFPADRASFFYRPVELFGVALGAARCSKAKPEDVEWLRDVLARGEQKLVTCETWTYYLGASASRALSHTWKPRPPTNLESLAAEELALLKWICMTDRLHAEALEIGAHESKITQALMSHMSIGSSRPQDAARAAVLYVSLQKSILQVLESSFERDWQAGKSSSRDATALLQTLCRRFHIAARQLLVRHSGRTTITISDEYDVQDLMHAMLNLHFNDVRAEEWTPSYAGNASRTDFLLKPEQIVIEVKMTRKNLDQKEVANQLIIDKERYRSHSDCKTLICFVYDPEGRCHNPTALESDLSDENSNPKVLVIVAPKGS